MGKRPNNSNDNFPKLNFAIKRYADKRVKSFLYDLNIILLKFPLKQYFSYLDFGRVELAIERNGAPRLSYWADPSIGSRNIFPAFTLRVIKFTPPPNSVLTHKQQHMPSWPFQAPSTGMNLKFRQIILAHDFNWLSELTFQSMFWPAGEVKSLGKKDNILLDDGARRPVSSIWETLNPCVVSADG